MKNICINWLSFNLYKFPYQMDIVMPLLVKSYSLSLTFLRFILFKLNVIFLISPKSKVSNIYKVLYVSWFCPKFKLVTLAQKHAFNNSCMISSVILFLTSFNVLNLLDFSIYSHIPNILWSPSSAPPKSITSLRSFFKS